MISRFPSLRRVLSAQCSLAGGGFNYNLNSLTSIDRSVANKSASGRLRPTLQDGRNRLQHLRFSLTLAGLGFVRSRKQV